MAFFKDVWSDTKKVLDDEITATSKTWQERVNAQLNEALSNTVTTVETYDRGYYSKLQAIGIIQRIAHGPLNKYRSEEKEDAYALLAYQSGSTIGRMVSQLYENEYNSIENEFDLQTGT